MILAITPNPALDVTYRLDSTRLHEVNRVQEVRTEAGGKGVNVARVLMQLGEAVTCAGPLGGPAGDELRQRLSASVSTAGRAPHGSGAPADTAPQLRQAWTRIDGTTRRTLAVVDDAGATGLYEPGPRLAPEEVQALLADVRALLTGAVPVIEAVTISGSLPGGMDDEDLAHLIGGIREAGLPVLVDTSGPALLTTARARATMLKPNAEEAMEATGAATALEAARALSELGAQIVVCSLGEEGMLGLQREGGSAVAAPGARAAAPGSPVDTPGAAAPGSPVDTRGASSSPGSTRVWRARLPQKVEGNPTGAGDSVVAALASSVLLGRTDLPTALRRAVAVGASAVTRPVAGEIDLELRDQLEPTVTIEEI